jgi:hypothetical protein
MMTDGIQMMCVYIYDLLIVTYTCEFLLRPGTYAVFYT